MAVVTQRKYGHIPADRVPAGATHFSTMVSGAIPSSVEHDEVIYDQLGAGACFGYAYGGAGESWLRWNGYPWQQASALAAYKLARMYRIADPDVPLADTGSDPANGVEGFAKFGVCAEKDHPYTDDPTKGLNERLALFNLEQMAITKLTGFAAIEETGTALCDAIRSCLAAKIPVCFATVVDDGFEAIQDDTPYDQPTGARRGGHALRFSGYKPGAFRVTNQWGTGWGDDGFCWLTDRYVMENCFDVYALRFAPVVTP